jgi:hypothetical protein
MNTKEPFSVPMAFPDKYQEALKTGCETVSYLREGLLRLDISDVKLKSIGVCDGSLADDNDGTCECK